MVSDVAHRPTEYKTGPLDTYAYFFPTFTRKMAKTTIMIRAETSTLYRYF